MVIIEKINDTEYRVGTFKVVRTEENTWVVSEGMQHIAYFLKREDAISWAKIMYTCADLVRDATLEEIEMYAKEHLGDE